MLVPKRSDVWGTKGRGVGKGPILAWSRKTQDGSRKKNWIQPDRAGRSEIADQVVWLLNQFEPPKDCPTKHDFVKTIAGYLNSKMDLQITLWPLCPEGEESPDILVEDLLAIEVNSYRYSAHSTASSLGRTTKDFSVDIIFCTSSAHRSDSLCHLGVWWTTLMRPLRTWHSPRAAKGEGTITY